MSRNKRDLESQLTPQQRKAAQLIIENEWGELIREDGRKRTMQELADEIGIARSTLYEWKALEPFIAYLNYLTDKQLEAMRTEANVGLMRLIRGGANGIPSVKALDLYMRRYGLLTDKTVVENVGHDSPYRVKSNDELRDEIAELDRLLGGESTDSVRPVAGHQYVD